MDALRHFVPFASVVSIVLHRYWCCALLLFRIWKGRLRSLGFVVILLQGHSLPAAVMCCLIVRLKLYA